MEVGSSSLPGTTHRTEVQCAQVASLPGTTLRTISAMCTGSVGIVLNIEDNNIKLYHNFETLYWGISSVG